MIHNFADILKEIFIFHLEGTVTTSSKYIMMDYTFHIYIYTLKRFTPKQYFLSLVHVYSDDNNPLVITISFAAFTIGM